MPSAMKFSMDYFVKHTVDHGKTEDGTIDLDLVPALDRSLYLSTKSPTTSRTSASTYLPPTSVSPSQRFPPTLPPIQTRLGNVTKNSRRDSATATQSFHTPATSCSSQRYPLSPAHAKFGDIAGESLVAAAPDARNGGFDVNRLPPPFPDYTPTTRVQIQLANLEQEARRYKLKADLQIAKRVDAMLHVPCPRRDAISSRQTCSCYDAHPHRAGRSSTRRKTTQSRS
jgi:hypothetical protein